MNVRSQTFLVVEYPMLEDAIIDAYTLSYDLVASEDFNNYSDYVVVPSPPVGEDEKTELQSWKDTGEGPPRLSLILWDMIQRDLIPSGDYLVRVFW